MLLTWENRLTWLALMLLVGATVYGVFVGAIVTLYYEWVPNMGAVDDTLGSVLFIPYLLASLISLVHLPLALADARYALWKQAALRLVAGLGPVSVFLGTDGLISHWLWWSPLSDTDRYHLLHHSLFAGVPLTLGYGVVLGWGWRPAAFKPTAAPSRRVWLVSGVMLLWLMMGLGIFTGLVTPRLAGLAVLLGLFAVILLWRMAGRDHFSGADDRRS